MPTLSTLCITRKFESVEQSEHRILKELQKFFAQNDNINNFLPIRVYGGLFEGFFLWNIKAFKLLISCIAKNINRLSNFWIMPDRANLGSVISDQGIISMGITKVKLVIQKLLKLV